MEPNTKDHLETMETKETKETMETKEVVKKYREMLVEMQKKCECMAMENRVLEKELMDARKIVNMSKQNDVVIEYLKSYTNENVKDLHIENRPYDRFYDAFSIKLMVDQLKTSGECI